MGLRDTCSRPSCARCAWDPVLRARTASFFITTREQHLRYYADDRSVFRVQRFLFRDSSGVRRLICRSQTAPRYRRRARPANSACWGRRELSPVRRFRL